MAEDITTIGDVLPDDFKDELAEQAGGYHSQDDLDWPVTSSTPAAEVEELVGKWSPKTSDKLGLFTGQLKDMMDEVAVDADAAKDYIDEELG